MLTRILVIGAFILLAVVIYFVVVAIMNRGPKKDTRRPPVDIVDRAQPSEPNPFESPEERIARLEEELRRLEDEDGDSPRGNP